MNKNTKEILTKKFSLRMRTRRMRAMKVNRSRLNSKMVTNKSSKMIRMRMMDNWIGMMLKRLMKNNHNSRNRHSNKNRSQRVKPSKHFLTPARTQRANNNKTHTDLSMKIELPFIKNQRQKSKLRRGEETINKENKSSSTSQKRRKEEQTTKKNSNTNL